ncbi:MAG: hypothetical protein PHU63_00825 [Candidatus ainarchaeum sp.]|nr:hypothetical protein [Candidatus ainarchaeum sp.]
MPFLASIPKINSERVRIVTRNQALAHKLKFWNRDPSAVLHLIGKNGETSRMYLIVEKGMDMQEILEATGRTDVKECEFGRWATGISYAGVVLQEDHEGGIQIKKDGKLPRVNGQWAAPHNIVVSGKNNTFELQYDPYTQDLPGGCSGTAKADFTQYGKEMVMWVDPGDLLSAENILRNHEGKSLPYERGSIFYVPAVISFSYWSVGKDLEMRARNEKTEFFSQTTLSTVDTSNTNSRTFTSESTNYTESSLSVELPKIVPTIHHTTAQVLSLAKEPEREIQTAIPQASSILIQNTRVRTPDFSEEENPIIRCIMDPVFRKLYGRLYGFVDGEEYTVREYPMKSIPSENLSANQNKPTRYAELGAGHPIFRKDYPKTSFPNTPKYSEPASLDDKRKRRKPIRTLVSLPESKVMPTHKSKKFLQSLNNPKPPENKSNKRTNANEQTPKKEGKKSKKKRKQKPQKPSSEKRQKLAVELPEVPRRFRFYHNEIRRFEQFFAKQMQSGKIKIQEFKLYLLKLEKELKQEIKLLVIKVKEYFRFIEHIKKLKEDIQKSWILNYTKLKLQKLVCEINYKVQELKQEITLLIKNIKIKTRNFISRLNSLKIIRLDDKTKTLKIFSKVLLLLLLSKWFKEN